MLTRIAPTPSGFLHIGNLCNFLLTWLWAKTNNGKILLRIDDADSERKKDIYLADIFKVLQWLGINWDIGAVDIADFEKNWSQQHRIHQYHQLISELADKNYLFACTCSRAQLLQSACTCQNKQLPLDSSGCAWRIKIPDETDITFTDTCLGETTIQGNTFAGNIVVRKKDGWPAYQVASLADDVNFGITHICRGADLLPSTAIQLYLAQCVSANTFSQCRFWHHPLLTQNDGEKISKSAGHQASSIINTYTKKQVFELFTQWMQWPAHADSLKVLLDIAFEKMSK